MTPAHDPNEPHPRWPRFTRGQIAHKRSVATRTDFPLIAFVLEPEGVYAVYSNGAAYQHENEQEARCRHRDLHGIAQLVDRRSKRART